VPFRCPQCGEEFTPGTVPLVGLALAVPQDIESIEKSQQFVLKFGQQFYSLAMIICEKCGFVFFTTYSAAKSSGLEPVCIRWVEDE
jgi:uncharacterized OB-fold protein